MNRIAMYAMVLSLGLFVFVLPVWAMPVTFSDGTFNDADWTSSIISQTGPPVSFSVQQVSTGGNLGEYRRLQHTYGGFGGLSTGHLLNGAIYNPGTQGAVSSVTFSYDLIGFDFGASLAVAYRGLIFQNGSFYSSFHGLGGTIFGPTTNQWESHNLVNLVASDFNLAGSLSATRQILSRTGAWREVAKQADNFVDDAARSAGKNSAPKGGAMFRHALQPFKGKAATNASRALTKHPNIVGVNAAPDRVMKALIDKFGSQAGINKAAADALKNIMRNGTRTTGPHADFGRVVDFKLPNGLGARFNAITNEFIGFLGRGL